MLSFITSRARIDFVHSYPISWRRAPAKNAGYLLCPISEGCLDLPDYPPVFHNMDTQLPNHVTTNHRLCFSLWAKFLAQP